MWLYVSIVLAVLLILGAVVAYMVISDLRGDLMILEERLRASRLQPDRPHRHPQGGGGDIPGRLAEEPTE